jgi:Root hair defective 3 GTP-binding protein (RHD3)
VLCADGVQMLLIRMLPRGARTSGAGTAAAIDCRKVFYQSSPGWLCRFSEVFSRDESGLPRSWGPRADVPGAAAQARGSAAHLLSLLAVIRTDVPPSTVAAVEASICSLAAQHVRYGASVASRLHTEPLQ